LIKKSRLSKSTFIRGLQCEKSLYLYKHHYRLKDPTPPSLQAVFDQITNILGEIVLSKDITNGESNLQTSVLNKGIYFINLYGERENRVLRFIKK